MHKRDTLNTFKNKEGFKVPNNYFDTLDSRIIDALPKETEENFDVKVSIPKSIPLWTRLRPISYLAAMLVGAILIIRAFVITGSEEPNLFTSNLDLDLVSDEFIQEAMVGAVLDEYAMYEFLTENLDYDEE